MISFKNLKKGVKDVEKWWEDDVSKLIYWCVKSFNPTNLKLNIVEKY